MYLKNTYKCNDSIYMFSLKNRIYSKMWTSAGQGFSAPLRGLRGQHIGEGTLKWRLGCLHTSAKATVALPALMKPAVPGSCRAFPVLQA